MKRHSTLFLLVLYTPVFLGIFMFHSIKFHLLQYLIMIMLLLPVIIKLRPKKYFLHKHKPIIQFCFFFIILQTIQSYFKGVGLYQIIDINVRFSLVLTVVFYLSCYSKDSNIRFIEKIFYIIGIIFFIQFILSAYESINNIFLDTTHNWALPTADFQSIRKRWLLQVIGIDFQLLDFFKHPFSGLLGQANFWAVQLAFYNLIFLYMYNKTKKNYFLLLVILIFVAVLFNTTRAAIFSILITDMFYIRYFSQSKKLKKIFFGGTVIIVFIYIGDIIGNFLIYFAKSDTLSGRIENYYFLAQYVFNNDFPFLIGYDVSQLLTIEYMYLSNWGFESIIFDVLFANGLLGLFLFAQFLVRVIRQGRKFNITNKYFSFLIIFNIIMVSVTLGDILLASFVLPFVALIYVYNVITDPFYNEIENKKYLPLTNK